MQNADGLPIIADSREADVDDKRWEEIGSRSSAGRSDHGLSASSSYLSSDFNDLLKERKD